MSRSEQLQVHHVMVRINISGTLFLLLSRSQYIQHVPIHLKRVGVVKSLFFFLSVLYILDRYAWLKLYSVFLVLFDL